MNTTKSMKTKRKIHKTSDPTWNAQTYGNSEKNPFNVEMIRYYNPREGRDQVIFLYSSKETGEVVKYRTLR